MDTNQHERMSPAPVRHGRMTPPSSPQPPVRPRLNEAPRPAFAHTLAAPQSWAAARRRSAGDLLVGGAAILTFLVDLGMPEDTDIYYLKRAGHWPIGKTSDGGGGQLIASKRRLTRHAQKITAPQKTDAA